MFSPILALLFGLSYIHTSMAIKCIAQPDYEELKKFQKEFPEGEEEEYDLEKYKQAWLRMTKTTGQVDCDEIARKSGLAKPTHCVTTDEFVNCRVFMVLDMFKGFAAEELRGIKAKECHFEEMNGPIRLLSTKELATANNCRHLENRFGCHRCQVCNETDYCNADTEMGTTGGKSTTEVTEKPEENGAGLPNGAPQALFLLLLALATGAFRWAAFL